MCESKKLSCGGKGPCCHVGYSHRHCEHCDVVIALAPQLPPNWLPNPPRQYWSNGNALTPLIGTQIPRPDDPNGRPPTVYAMNSGTASGTLLMEGFKAHSCEETS